MWECEVGKLRCNDWEFGPRCVEKPCWTFAQPLWRTGLQQAAQHPSCINVQKENVVEILVRDNFHHIYPVWFLQHTFTGPNRESGCVRAECVCRGLLQLGSVYASSLVYLSCKEWCDVRKSVQLLPHVLFTEVNTSKEKWPKETEESLNEPNTKIQHNDLSLACFRPKTSHCRWDRTLEANKTS